ncbi:MAG TPA: ribonucleotide-diphosphate reductase subunit beta [Allocoleopsis sp.]
MTTFNTEIEPILKESSTRFVLFPIVHNDLYDLYIKSRDLFWKPEEIDFTKDREQFEKLKEEEKFFIENILAFFVFSDGIVNENLAINFYNEVQISEARQVYSVQILIEAIHSHTYSLMIDTLILDSNKKSQLFDALNTNEIVKKKAEWGLKWFDKNKSFPERLVAFIVVEGVFFSASFAAFFWLKQRNLLPGLTKANEFISRDESLHAETGVLLYSKLIQKIPESRIHEIFKEAFDIEKEFITESIPVRMIEMNEKMMIQYIEYVVDYWLVKLNYSKIFNSKNPFPFMEYLSMESKANFFERKVSEYSLMDASVDNEIKFDEDF